LKIGSTHSGFQSFKYIHHGSKLECGSSMTTPK
jgi:hypothetical protein